MHPRETQPMPGPRPQAMPPARIHLVPGKTQTAWEAALASTLPPGASVLIAGRGPIVPIWAGIATRLGLVVEVQEDADAACLARHLGADRFGRIKALMLVEGQGPLDAMAARHALDACFHDALLLIDASMSPPPPAACHADIVIAEGGLAALAAARPVIAAE